MRRGISIILLFLLMISAVGAVGISPSKTYVDFEPNKVIAGSCLDIADPGCVCVRKDTGNNITFSVGGDLPGTVNLSTIKFDSVHSPWSCYTYDIEFPALADKAGDNVIKILATDEGDTAETFAVTLTVDQKLIVNVDQKYVKQYEPPALDMSRVMVYSSIVFVFIILIFILLKIRNEADI